VNNSGSRSVVLNAVKWASITEIAAKIIQPVTNMILARILLPEAFGVVVAISMVVSFIDIFTDAGFQKYLVQHEFENKQDQNNIINVAFWTSLLISVLFWGGIIVFRNPIAILIGNPMLGNVIVISCMQLPLNSIYGIQMALYRRKFDFHTLFVVRMVAVFLPFIVTIPLALFGLSYWALIIGSICGNLVSVGILTIKSEWKPNCYYNFEKLKDMLSFSVWSLIEAISIWLTAWVDALIVGSVLSSYYLGIYRTSLNMVNSLMAVVTASTTTVLFVALSRLQDNNEAFNKAFFDMQRATSIILFPMGVGLFLYSDVATRLFLGSEWEEASSIIGIWALMTAISIVFGHYSSEAYRAKGKPKLSFLAQMLHLVVLVPTCLIAMQYSFMILVYARALIKIQIVIVHLIIMRIEFKISPFAILKNTVKPMLFTITMTAIAILLKMVSSSLVWSIISIAICVVAYAIILYLFDTDELKKIQAIFLKRKRKLTISN